MDKAKYNRAAKDPSQLQQFVDEVCDNAGGSVTDLYLEIEEEPTQEQLEQVYKQKPDVLRLGMAGSEHVIVLHKSLQSESETRLNYFNVQTSEGVVQVIKIEYSEEDGYIMENYEWSLDEMSGGGKMYLHHVQLYLKDQEGDCETCMRIICSKSEAFASFAEMLSYAMAKSRLLDDLVVSDDNGEGDYKIRLIASYTENELVVDGGNQWHTSGYGVPTSFIDAVTEL